MTKRQKIRKVMVLFSFVFFPVTIFYLSPYLAIEASASGIIAGCIILFAAQFLTSLFFGRAFCGWVCPVAGLDECCGAAGGKIAKNGKTRFIKYAIWIPWTVSIVLLFINAGGVKSFDPLFMTHGGLPLLGLAGHIIYYGVVLFILIMTLIRGRRVFCHTLCWMAPFMVIGAKLKDALRYPSLKISCDETKCVDCGQCSNRCVMGLNVRESAKTKYIKNSECIMCGQCVDICKHDVLKYTIS